MKITNPWVGYITRGYSTIRQSVLQRLKTAVPEMTDFRSSNLLVIIVDIFAGITEKIHFYIDNMAREAFTSTARKWGSMLRLARIVDYRVRCSIPAAVDIQMTFVDTGGNSVALQAPFTIPINTVVTSSNGLVYKTIGTTILGVGDIGATLTVKEHTLNTGISLGLTSASPSQQILLPIAYEHGTLALLINGIVHTEKSTLGFSGPLDKHFVVDVNEYGYPYIQLGDGIHGYYFSTQQSIVGDYYTTTGSLGNVEKDMLTFITLTPPTQIPAIDHITVINPFASTTGLGIESIEDLRKSIPLSIRTMNRAVTRQDHIDIAKLCPGVNKAAILFTCGKYIDLYIAPQGGGIPSTQLLTDCYDFFEAGNRKMVTTFIRVSPTGETPIKITIVAKGKDRVDVTVAAQDIRDALTSAYSSDNSDVNAPVRMSDIIAIVDNLFKIDYLSLGYIGTVPYARPALGNTHQLIWTGETMGGSTTLVDWKLMYDAGLSKFKLFKNGLPQGNIDWDVLYTSSIINILIPSSILGVPVNNTIVNGDTWLFRTYPVNKDILIDDYTVPVILSADLSITIN